ncbi:PepSY domain-containing protein [Sphingobium nicotianae]|uniref:PepSY domain-containing protein n=1 Tax=Sphingobium nicotianae TaxID=2782607 RepID=A0A9X1ISD3_9SPHN|nr:PepSY domain-containing protein [Sphingobium nicotianae]MBT2188292.1 PepSY domain-containing protein [Sphingobium nicotianae]
MRRWHKILAPWFALILVIVAFTGVVTQVTSTLDTPPPTQATSPRIGEHTRSKVEREKRSALGEWNHWFKKLHSGEALGPIGIAANAISGLALLFFAGSGFWMYLSMWLKLRRNRRRRVG